MTFLRGCNFSLETCKRKLDMYFTMKTAVPEFFRNRDVARPELRQILKQAHLVCMPGLTPDGKRVSIAGASPDFHLTNVADLFKLLTMMADVRLHAEKFGVAGDVYILDAAATSLTRQFLKMSPVLLKKFFVCVQEAYPVKIKEVHVVNAGPVVEMIMAVVRPLLKEKLRSRIHLHSRLESLHQFVPKDLLPEEYGGSAGRLEEVKENWTRTLEEYGGWFKEQEGVGADETRRPGRPTSYDTLFGVEGSFRQLTID
ncbi:alpha-tocopherol transfer protein-like isoform X2 [Tenebrio molitor]